MNIALWHNLPSGGGKRALYHHIEGLVERGHQVTVWCPDTADEAYLPLDGLAPVRRLVFPWPEGRCPWPGLRSAPLSLTVRGRLRAMEAHCRACAEEMAATGADILLACSCRFFAAPPIGAHFKPSVLYLQEPYRDLYEARPRWPWAALPISESWKPGPRLHDLLRTRAYRIQARAEAAHAGSFDRILVNSRFSRESVLRAYNFESRVCPLGIDTEHYRPGRKAEKPYVVGLGGVYFGKGIDRAIRAMAALPASSRPPLVWIANQSRSAYLAEVEHLAASLDVDLQLRLEVQDEEVVQTLSAATVMIYPSRLEPFGFAPLEANACGTPVVAIAEGGIRETIQHGENGLLIDGDDPAAWAAALLTYLEHPGPAQEAGARARAHVERRWKWAFAIDRLERELLQVLQQAKGGGELPCAPE